MDTPAAAFGITNLNTLARPSRLTPCANGVKRENYGQP
jgi:hypothetical protein